MTSRAHSPIASANSFRIFSAAVWLFAFSALNAVAQAQPSPTALAAYDDYIHSVESRLTRQHRSRTEFLAGLLPGSQADQQLRRGGLVVEDLTPHARNTPGALLSHWRATAFVPGATASEFTSLLRHFSAYPRIFAPQVVSARVLEQSATRACIALRMLQHHVLTVTLDGTFHVAFGQLDPQRVWSTSASTSIAEIASPNKPGGYAITVEPDHGFLWRLNTWWSYEQRDGGLYLQIESVSLSRSIPFGLAWAVGPYVQSIPRDSLTFTLNAARRTLEHSTPAKESSSLASLRDERK
ncbi:MAG TPA: hypothetical protein VGR64_03430 [Terracidiphilus sp.]|nr:hypothetical protein [Terracidiphilus sp.]